MARHTFFATCAPGLESLLYEEVRALKLGRTEQQVGGVRFEGELRDGCRANLWLRTAIRVLLRLERFEVYDGDALYKVVARHDWSRFLRPDGSLWVQAQSRESSLDHTRFIAQRVKDAIVDQLRTEDGVRPSVERENADLRVHVHIWRDRATLSVDTSGESLHRRGWRRVQGRAPLPETMAAAMVLASGWDRRAPLIDPFCGSGTILVEAHRLAAGAAPCADRKRFGFETWPIHREGPWRRQVDEARAAVRSTGKTRFLGLDLDRERLEAARVNAEAAGVGELLSLERADAREFAPKPGWNAWVVSNLPFGERIRGRDLHGLHRAFGAALRERCQGYRYALLVGEPALAQALALPGARRSIVVLGGTERLLLVGAL